MRLGGRIGLLELLPNGWQEIAHLQRRQRVGMCRLEVRVRGRDECKNQQENDWHGDRGCPAGET